MQVYAAIVGGTLAFTAQKGLDRSILYFLLFFTLFGLFNTMRWTHAFEHHREKVNEFARILSSKTAFGPSVDPSMNTPPMCIVPSYVGTKEIPTLLRKINEFFRTRYLFAAFYFAALEGTCLLIMLTESSILGKIVASAVPILATLIVLAWASSLPRETKKVVLEGSNGEWSQKRYLPFLVEKASKGSVELWAIDISHQPRLEGMTRHWWRATTDLGRVHYFNKLSPIDKHRYSALSQANTVLIVTPDRSHCSVAKFWLSRLDAEGKIVIEKPLDASLACARNLRIYAVRQGRLGAVYGFDHYLALADSVLCKNRELLKKIGEIHRIEFHILESSEVEPERVETLDNGVILDLFSHALAVSATILSDASSMEEVLRRVSVKEVQTGRYDGSPISGETFARIVFSMNQTTVESFVGKGVGREEWKTVSIKGPNRKIEIDFSKETLHADNLSPRRLNMKQLEASLGRILADEGNLLSVPGILSFDGAFEILRIIDKTRKMVRKSASYLIGDSLETILRKM